MSKIAARAETIYRAAKPFVALGIVALAGYLFLPIVAEYLSRPEAPQILGIGLIVIALALIGLSQKAARKPPRPTKKFLKQLLHSEPITPKHNPPKVAGGKYPRLVDDDDCRFFVDFAEFGDVVNWWFTEDYVGSRWRLQELPDGDLRLVDYSDGPIYGRCYDIFHSQIKLGRLEIHPGYRYSAENPNVITEIEIDSVRLLSFGSVAGFLKDIAAHVCDSKAKTDSNFDANSAIVGALTKALWETQRITEFEDLDGQGWGQLSLQLHGHASPWYFSRREALQKKPALRSESGRREAREESAANFRRDLERMIERYLE